MNARIAEERSKRKTHAVNSSTSSFRDRVRAHINARLGSDQRRKNSLPSVAEQLGDTIKRLIFEQEYPPGTRLLENELAERFGVSRAPVRDALRMLDKQGFVELVPRRGAVVYQPTPGDISNLYEIRAELFALAARKAAVAMDSQTRELAEEGVRLILQLGQDKKTSPQDFFEVRTGLGWLVLLAANNPRLTALVDGLGQQAITHTRVFESPAHRLKNARTWERLYAAIVSHDEATAMNEARELVFGSRDELLRQMRES